METAEAPSEGSAFSRMFNILAAPGEVFAEIKERPVAHANWILPAIVWTVIGIAATMILFSQDWALREIRKSQAKAMQTGFDESVKKGKMTQAQADQTLKATEDFMERYGGLTMKISGIVGTVLYAFLSPFFWGFIIWFFGVKIFKGDFEFMKAVEAAGLCAVIYMLAGVLVVLVDMILGRITTISPALLIQDFDFSNKSHMALAALNPLYFWYVAVISVATATLSGASFGKAATWIFTIWIGLRAVLILLNMGQFTM